MSNAKGIRESIYPPLPPVATQENIDVYTLLFEHPNPYDDPEETNKLPVLTDPVPAALHDVSRIDEELNWTLPELKRRVELCGRMLRNKKWGLEVQRGDVVGILGWAGIGFATIEYGTFWNYGTVSFMCPTWEMEQVYHQMKEARTKILAIHSSLLFTLGLPAAYRLQIPLHRIILLDESPPDDFLQHEIASFKDHHFFTVEELLNMQKIEEEDAPIQEVEVRRTREEVGFDCEKDVALLCSTSGTTGLPKAVMLSHRNVVSSVVQSCGRPCDRFDGEVLREESYISIPPWFHQGGQAYGLLVALYKRMNNVILERIDVERFLELAKKYKPFEFILYPYIADLLCNPPHSETIDPSIFSHTRSAVLAGATVPQATIRNWYEHFTKIPIREAMGATEATAVTMCQDFETYTKNVGSCGKLVRGMKGMLLPLRPPVLEELGGIKEEMIITQDNTPGELYCAGPNIMMGYLNEEKKTKEVLVNFAGEKWYRTGDLVVTRNGGIDFWHLARIRDLIWFKDMKGEEVGRGWQFNIEGKRYICIQPLIIENVLGRHEAVRECAVVGVKDEKFGSVPKAFVVLREGEWDDDELGEEIVRFVDLKVEEEWLHLKGGVQFVGVLPKNVAGKVLRNQLLGDQDPK